MTFIKHKSELINQLENTPEFIKDTALQRIVELLKRVDSVEMLRKEKGLINKISVDSIEDRNAIELILSFTSNYVKKDDES